MKSSRMSIIIYSCWKNRDMWNVFSILFRKYWSDCQYPIVLVTDEYYETDGKYIFDKIVVKNDTWANMIRTALIEINTPYAMLFMDDYLLCDQVDNNDIEKQIDRIQRYNAINLKLVESPKCKGIFCSDRNVGFYELGNAYSLSTQVGIWKSDYLLNSIELNWSAWDFERIGSMRKGKKLGPILVSLDYVFPYEEGVRRGKWMIQGAKLCERNGIKIDVNRRPIMTNKDMAWLYFKGAIIDWNPNLILRIQNLFK